MNIFFEKSELARKLQTDTLVTPVQEAMLEEVNGSVLDYTKTIGMVGEYLSQTGRDVDLFEYVGLVRSFRRGVVPNSKVRMLAKLGDKMYDYVMVQSDAVLDVVGQYATKGIIKLHTGEIVDVEHNNEERESVSEDAANQADATESSQDLHSDSEQV